MKNKNIISFIGTNPLFLLLPIIVAVSFLGINQYQYGMWNQFISIPWLQDLLNPALYPHDLLVKQSVNSPTVFLLVLTKLLPLFGSIPLLFLSVYLFNHFLLFASVYRLSFSVFKNQQAALLLLVALSFSFPVLGDIHIWSTSLMERTLAFPILLFSIAAQFRKQFWWAVFLQGVAFNIHPLSSLFVVLVSWPAVLYADGFKKSIFLYGALFLLIASPVLYLKFSLPAEETSLALQDIWLKVMRIRNAHHALPSSYNSVIWLKSLAVVIVFFVLNTTAKLHPYFKKYLFAFALGIGVLLFIGTIFTEVYPLKLILQLQFFRSFRFLIVLCFLLFTGLVATEPKPLYYLLSPLLLFQYFGDDALKSLAAIGLLAFSWFAIKYWAVSAKSIASISLCFAIAGALAFTQRDKRAYTKGLQSEEWYELQEWFAENTSDQSLVIVPPHQLGFRVYSQRSSYGDWYDGTKAFFSEEYAEYWWRHMGNIGCTNPDSLIQDYSRNPLSSFINIANHESPKYPEIYLIHYEKVKLSLPVYQHFPSFNVYRLK